MLGMDKATDNFSTFLTQSLRNPRDYSPLRRNYMMLIEMISMISNVKTWKRFGQAAVDEGI